MRKRDYDHFIWVILIKKWMFTCHKLSLPEKWDLKVQKYLKILPESTAVSFLLKSM